MYLGEGVGLPGVVLIDVHRVVTYISPVEAFATGIKMLIC